MSTDTKELAELEKNQEISAFKNMGSFENAMRMAKMLVKSSLVPRSYQGEENIPNAVIAIEISSRIGISPFMVIQNLDIIQGKPSWRSSFIIAALNSCGRFKPMRFVFEGEKGTDDYGCRAVTKDMDGEDLIGPIVDWRMVKAEGWLSKSGSKWKTMPELMFQYRSAAFFGRLYAPDILIGMHTNDEMTDISKVKVENKKQELIELFEEKMNYLTDDDILHIDRIIQENETASFSKAIKTLKNLKENDTKQQ